MNGQKEHLAVQVLAALSGHESWSGTEDLRYKAIDVLMTALSRTEEEELSLMKKQRDVDMESFRLQQELHRLVPMAEKA